MSVTNGDPEDISDYDSAYLEAVATIEECDICGRSELGPAMDWDGEGEMPDLLEIKWDTKRLCNVCVDCKARLTP